MIDFQIGGKNVIATPTGIKISARGKVTNMSAAYGSMSKGDARKLRKALRAAGHIQHAAASRCAA